MAKSTDPAVKIERAILDELVSLAGGLVPKQTANGLARECVIEMITLLKTEPENRQMPMLVRLVDASKEGGNGGFGKPTTSERPKITRPKSLRSKREEN
jgi:hypothetical protein